LPQASASTIGLQAGDRMSIPGFLHWVYEAGRMKRFHIALGGDRADVAGKT
jgi:hypothetical protein